MESPQNLKKRLKSVSNINKITKAMELVAATKMRKSQEIALASRPYAFAAMELLANLSVLGDVKKQDMPEIFKHRQVKKVLFLLVASDKGLAGAFNSSVFKKFEQHMEKAREEYKTEEKVFVAVGEKANAYLLKKKYNVLKKFVQAGDYTTTDQTSPIAEFVTQGFLEKKWDRVVAISMHFRSALKQEPHVRMVLPVDFDSVADIIQQIIPERGKFADLMRESKIDFFPDKPKGYGKEYLIEPSPVKVLEQLAKHLLFMQVYHLVLEANASEHSARRAAMKTASDNASDLGQALNLQYNKSRQAAITTQITEIAAGAEALQ